MKQPEGAKAIANAVYGKPAHRSYFAGCSTGGRQAASEAERYPDDFDGILKYHIMIRPKVYTRQTFITKSEPEPYVAHIFGRYLAEAGIRRAGTQVARQHFGKRRAYVTCNR